MILCGTDLSPVSEPVIKAAAAVARKQGRELLLVTVLAQEDPNALTSAQVRLEQDAGQLRREQGISVETVVAHGHPDQCLLELARQQRVADRADDDQRERERREQTGREPH